MTDSPKTMPEREPGYGTTTATEAALQQAAIRFAANCGPLAAAGAGDMRAREDVADKLLTALGEAGLDIDGLLSHPARGMEDQGAILERMARAIRDQNRTHIKQSHPNAEFGREWLTDHDWALARAALDAARAPTVTVPPLEWHENGLLTGLRSQGPLHSMEVYENEGGSWTLDDGETVSPHATLEAAKAAGRAALERRIRDVCEGKGNG